MTFWVAGTVPQQLRAQSGYHWTLPVIPVKFNSTGSQGEPIIIPVDAGHYHQGTMGTALAMSTGFIPGSFYL